MSVNLDTEIKALYASNSDFKAYVDKYSNKYQSGTKISVNEALTHVIVREVAEKYVKEVVGE